MGPELKERQDAPHVTRAEVSPVWAGQGWRLKAVKRSERHAALAHAARWAQQLKRGRREGTMEDTRIRSTRP